MNMPDIKCKYVVVRFVDDPVREEARNIGVLLQSPDAGYFAGLFTDELRRKLAGLIKAVDLDILQEYIRDFSRKFQEAERWREAPNSLFERPEYLQTAYLDSLSDRGFGKLV
jgi:alpha-glucuronidase